MSRSTTETRGAEAPVRARAISLACSASERVTTSRSKGGLGLHPCPEVPFGAQQHREPLGGGGELVDLERVPGAELALLEKARAQVLEVGGNLEAFELDSRHFQAGEEPKEDGDLSAFLIGLIGFAGVARGRGLDLDVAEDAEGEELLDRATHRLRTVRLAGRKLYELTARLGRRTAGILQPDFPDDAPAIALGGAGDGILTEGEPDHQHRQRRHSQKLFRNFTSTPMSPSSSRDRIQDIGPSGVYSIRMIASVAAFRLVE